MNAASQDLRLVRTGLTLVLFGLALFVLTLIAGSILRNLDPAIGIRVLPLLLLMMFGASALSLAGRFLCFAVPEESRAKGIIGWTIGLECLAIGINVGRFLGRTSALVEGVASLASLAALVLFVLFLMRLATFLDVSTAASQAENLLWWGGWVFALLVITILAVVFMPGGGLVAMLSIPVMLIVGVIMTFRYVQLINWLREEIAEAD